MTFWLHTAAAMHPDRIAIEGPERALTYAQLRDGARARGARGDATRAGVALGWRRSEEFVDRAARAACSPVPPPCRSTCG